MENQESIINVKSVAGNWSGKVRQVLSDKSVEYEMKMRLHEEGDKVSSDAQLVLAGMHLADDAGKPVESETLSIKGAVYEDRFLHLNYKNPNENLHFGYIVIDLCDHTVLHDHQMIKGLFIGYGPMSKKLINGEIVLKKSNF